MSATALPSGFVPAFHPSGFIRSIAHTGILLSGTNVNILKGQPVKLLVGPLTTNGVVVPAGQVFLAPITAVGDAIFGVFAGCEYFDNTGAPQEANAWLASTPIQANTSVTAFIWEDPAIVYTAQTDGALPVITAAGTQYAQFEGREFNASNFAAGSAATGLSQATLAATPVAVTTQGQFQCVKLDPSLYNVAQTSDAFVQLQVRVARSQVAAAFPSI